jgi:hypothetical protein
MIWSFGCKLVGGLVVLIGGLTVKFISESNLCKTRSAYDESGFSSYDKGTCEDESFDLLNVWSEFWSKKWPDLSKWCLSVWIGYSRCLCLIKKSNSSSSSVIVC